MIQETQTSDLDLDESIQTEETYYHNYVTVTAVHHDTRPEGF